MGALLPLGGRLWWFICPIPAPGEWLQRKAIVDPPGNGRAAGLLSIAAPAPSAHRWTLSQGWRWPKSLRGIWLQNLGFLAVALFSTVILTRPSVTGWVLLGFLAGGVGLAMLFERRSLCRYVCPVGGFIGLYSLVAPLELRVRDPLVCQEHRTKDCYLGNAAGYGCPWLEQPWTMERNASCGLCGECLRTCTEDNVTVNLRLPGSDLLVAHGWKLDEAYKAFIMLACAAIYPVVFLGPWGWLKEGANLDTLSGFGVYALAFLALNLVALPALHLSTAALTRWVSGLDIPLGRLFVRWHILWCHWGWPLGWHSRSRLSLPICRMPCRCCPTHFVGDGTSWEFETSPGTPFAGWVPPIQAALLIAGLIASIVAADAILRKLHEGGMAFRGLAIQAIALTAETTFLLWLYLGATA